MKNQNRFGVIKKEWIENLISLPKEEKERFFERIGRALHGQKERILEQAFKKKIFTKEEYENNYKDMFYDEFGFDSFLQYLDAVMNADSDYFVTGNENLLKKRKELESRFNLKIISVEELEKLNP